MPASNQKIIDVRQTKADEKGMGESFVMITLKDSTMNYHKISPREGINKNKTK